jgi:hypothetical protein
MQFTPSKLNTFLFFNLPSAYWCGVRVKQINSTLCTATVKHKWFNQNPFNSMYFAVQAMAAELTTGALVMYHINNSGKKISMLVANNKATFSKKAKGRITFNCAQGELAAQAIARAVATGEGQTLWMTAQGKDESGDVVSVMEFEWTIKAK